MITKNLSNKDLQSFIDNKNNNKKDILEARVQLAKNHLGSNFFSHEKTHYGNSYYGPLTVIRVNYHVFDHSFYNKLGFGLIIQS